MVAIDQTKWAYIAGLFDGEGCVTIQRMKPRTRPDRNVQHYLKIIISNTDKNIIYWLAKECGGYTFKHKPVNIRSKPEYEWHSTSRIAGQILSNIYPYLQIKKKRAALALLFQSKMAHNRYKRLPRKEIEFKERVYNKMKKLNQKGTMISS